MKKKTINYIPTCKFCGGPVEYDKPKNFVKTVNGQDFILSVCQDCLLERFPHIKNLSRIFNTCNEVTCCAFNIPEDVRKQSNNKYSWTKEKAIKKYGEEEGMRIWNGYCEKQATTNTFDYKKEKYGWTIEQFNEYNKSRAVTLENLIERHGEEEGKKMWGSYCKKQSETKSWDWMVEKFGEEKAIEINRSKAITLENMIKKYGEEEGTKRYEEYCKSKASYSTVSQMLFNELDKYLGNKYTTYYATKNKEYSISSKTKSYLLDYYIEELKICIEFNGDAWHGNPNRFSPDNHCHPFHKELTAKDLQDIDKKRTNYLKKLGIKTFVIWESDFKPEKFNYLEYIKNVLKIEL